MTKKLPKSDSLLLKGYNKETPSKHTNLCGLQRLQLDLCPNQTEQERFDDFPDESQSFSYRIL